MAFNFRNAFVRDALPEYRAFLLVDRVDLPCVLRIVLDGSDVAKESVASLVLHAVNRRGDENLVAPNNRARVGQTGDFQLPTYIVGFRCVPGHRLSGTLNDTCRAWTTKLRPVLCRRSGYDKSK